MKAKTDYGAGLITCLILFAQHINEIAIEIDKTIGLNPDIGKWQ